MIRFEVMCISARLKVLVLFLSNQELAECVCGSLSGVSERCAFRDAEMKKSGIVIDVDIAL